MLLYRRKGVLSIFPVAKRQESLYNIIYGIYMKAEIKLRNKQIMNVALGGMLAGVAVVIMCLGGLIPFATYVCPILCILTGNIVLTLCGVKWSWIWYFTVSILSLLLAPDREAAVVYVFLGAYPCTKRILDRFPLRWLWKLLYFNLAALASYWASVYIMGLSEIALEFRKLGYIGLTIILVLANVTFVGLDYLLSRFEATKIN